MLLNQDRLFAYISIPITKLIYDIDKRIVFGQGIYNQDFQFWTRRAREENLGPGTKQNVNMETRS